MKKFNITGTCNPKRHYMVDTSAKLKQILKLIEDGEYFVINRPRQYGKTTTLFRIEKALEENKDYLIINISFEGMGDDFFESPKTFCPTFLQYISKIFSIKQNNSMMQVNDFPYLSKAISEALTEIDSKVVLLIDEVDKSSNNQLFLNFLGMLRDKYLKAQMDKDITFHSVVLAGVHDVKSLKLKLRPDEERKYNSPWNIAADFNVDMSFKPAEIATMLSQYSIETKNEMDIPAVSQRIFFWTNGYPFLVSKLCKIVDETILPERNIKNWTPTDIDEAVKQLLNESNTLFDDLIKNLENNKELFGFIERIIFSGISFTFVISSPLTNLAYIYGYIQNNNGKISIHNKIFEEYISNHITAGISEKNQGTELTANSNTSLYLKPSGKLDMTKVMLKFQEVIKEKYSQSDALKSDEFLEKDLRLLFLVFLKPIINGIGFSFKEVETSAEKRLDIVVVFRDEKFVVELKIWRGEEYHNQGKQRLKEYMLAESVNKSFMLIMDKRRTKEFVHYEEDEILIVWI
ncbi:MAG: AAA family ATPase [Candidatus Riflebacteria bacterium]|nr:AAA family ATPase [Candidatus Riflebacteria bacterium]